MATARPYSMVGLIAIIPFLVITVIICPTESNESSQAAGERMQRSKLSVELEEVSITGPHKGTILHTHGSRMLSDSGTTSTRVSNDAQTLLEFKKHITHDPSNTLADWRLTTNKNNRVNNTSTAHVCCTWTGVTCNSKHQVVELGLQDSSLFGTIWPGICNLTYLSSLDLSGNNFSGNIPPELLKNCHRLNVLNLSDNSLDGEIPLDLNCQRLTVLDLSVNTLDGEIPAELGRLPRLQELYLQNNRLSGYIPQNLSHSLTSIDLSSNQLIGTIPDALGELMQLQSLVLYFNNLSGTIPQSLGNCSNLSYVDLASNRLSGSIPKTFGDLRQLSVLSLSENKLTGSIPQGIGQNQNLFELDLGNNKLTGTIPDTFCESLSVDITLIFNLTNNNLTGSIPQSLGNCSNLELLDMSSNNLNGHLPNSSFGGSSGNLYWLDLSYNQFSGTIPDAFGDLELGILQLNDNNLTGNIPRSLGNCKALDTLDLSFNRFTGIIPESFGDLTILNLLYLNDNNLTGTIPKSLQKCHNMVQFQCGYNQLTGDLSSTSNGSFQLDFHHWPFVEIFSITNNNLTGYISPSFGSKNSSLVLIDLSHNQLRGHIPRGLPSAMGKNLSTLRVISLAYNHLSGSIPLWIASLTSLEVLDLSHNHFNGTIPQNLHKLEGFKGTSNGSNSTAAFRLDKVPVDLYSKGILLRYTYILGTNTHFDVSSNALHGTIPTDIGELVGLVHLYLSNNQLIGDIPPNIGKLRQLEAMDFSFNKLTGIIPLSLELLNYINYFDVSYNNLSGPIPTAAQFGLFTNSSYLPGNDGLCGKVIHRMCPQNNSSPTSPSQSTFSKHITYGFTNIISVPSFLIGNGVGFCTLMSLVIFWDPARAFMMGSSRYKESNPMRYGLFKRPT